VITHEKHWRFIVKECLQNYAKIGVSHHTFFPCKDDPIYHMETLPRVLQREDLECIDLTVPYGEPYRSITTAMIRASGKTIIYNGYLMPTAKIPLCTTSPTERAQILILAKDQVNAAYEAGSTWFMQSVGADPGPENRSRAFDALGEYIHELSQYMASKGSMAFLIELMDRNMHRRSLCGPTGETIEFMRNLKERVPNVGVVVDLGHIPLMEETFLQAFTKASEFLQHVHLGNCILKDRSHPQWGDMHPPIGLDGGEIDVPEIAEVLRILLDIGYLNKVERGTLSLEIKTFPGMTPEETLDDNIGRINQAWEMI
jgi:sugar phosphate isomerase/epimerase